MSLIYIYIEFIIIIIYYYYYYFELTLNLPCIVCITEEWRIVFTKKRTNIYDVVIYAVTSNKNSTVIELIKTSYVTQYRGLLS